MEKGENLELFVSSHEVHSHQRRRARNISAQSKDCEPQRAIRRAGLRCEKIRQREVNYEAQGASTEAQLNQSAPQPALE